MSQTHLILTKPDFNDLKIRGRKRRIAPRVLAVTRSADDFKVGWTIPRYIGKAVLRNKIKRRLRMLSREWRTRWRGHINLIFLKYRELEKSKEGLDWTDLKSLEGQFSRLYDLKPVLEPR